MTRLAFMLVLFGTALGAIQPANKSAPPAHQVLAHLQGTWHFESLEQAGRKLTAEEVKGRSVFVGGDLFLVRDADKILYSGQITLDPNQSPATFSVATRQENKLVDVLLGIYELDGDALTLCFVGRGHDRPKEFKADAGSNVKLAICKRYRPTGDVIDIVGTYKAQSASGNGQSQETLAQIERRGDAYVMTFRHGAAIIYVGVAIRQGDTLSMAWGRQNQVGVSVYKIEKGPRLVGQYTTLGGPGLVLPEVLVSAAPGA